MVNPMFQPPENYQRGQRVNVPNPEICREEYGIIVRRLRWHVDPRGCLTEVFRMSWGNDRDIRESNHTRQVYISATARGVVKGWHLHQIQSDRFFLLSGRALLVTCDLRALGPHVAPGPFVETMLDVRDPVSVTVLPGVAHGWIALDDCAILNCVSHEYRGDDEFRTDPHGPVCPDGPIYNWFRRRDG